MRMTVDSSDAPFRRLRDDESPEEAWNFGPNEEHNPLVQFINVNDPDTIVELLYMGVIPRKGDTVGTLGTVDRVHWDIENGYVEVYVA